MARALLLWLIGVPIRISLMAWLWAGLCGQGSGPMQIGRLRANRAK